MVDLDDAGQRLAATRVAPTPPVAKLHARLRRRRRRRLTSGASAVAAMVAAIVLVVMTVASAGNSGDVEVVTGPPSNTVSPVTLPALAAVRGSSPYDFDRLRLWLPHGWTTSNSDCHDGTDVVYVPAAMSSGDDLAEPSCTPNPATSQIVVTPLTGATRSGAPMIVNGITVRTDASASVGSGSGEVWGISSLGVSLSIGGEAEKVAATLGPSPLEDLLTRHLPSPVPTKWRAVAFDGFVARVPASWVPGGSVGDLDLCAAPLFRTPEVYLGSVPSINCPDEPSEGSIAVSSPNDGLWLQPSNDPDPLAAQAKRNTNSAATLGSSRLVSLGTTQALITPAAGDTVNVELVSGTHRIEATIGLGENPAVAQAILSSITPEPATKHLAGRKTSPVANYGTLQGTLRIAGGPAPGISRPVPGTVRARHDGRTITAAVGNNGHFSMAVPPGTYQVTGNSPNISGMTCVAGAPRKVLAGKTTTLQVTCNVP